MSNLKVIDPEKLLEDAHQYLWRNGWRSPVGFNAQILDSGGTVNTAEMLVGFVMEHAGLLPIPKETVAVFVDARAILPESVECIDAEFKQEVTFIPISVPDAMTLAQCIRFVGKSEDASWQKRS
jgi:hypothetical protein